MTTPRAADSIFHELRKRRRCGVLHAGLLEATELLTVASAFQLAADAATYRAIDITEARRVLARVLHRDLAYDTKIMPVADADRLASEVLSLVPDAQLFTNGNYGSQPAGAANGVTVGPSWNPATSATFDTGVIAVGVTTSACVWVEDED